MSQYSKCDHVEFNLADCRGILHRCECICETHLEEGYDYNVYKIDDVVVKEVRIANVTNRYAVFMRCELEQIMEERDNAIKWNAEVLYKGALVPYGGWHKPRRT